MEIWFKRKKLRLIIVQSQCSGRGAGQMPGVSDSAPHQESWFLLLKLWKQTPGLDVFHLSEALPVLDLCWVFQTGVVCKPGLKSRLPLSWVLLSWDGERERSRLLDSLHHLTVPPLSLISSDARWWCSQGSKERGRERETDSGDRSWPSGLLNLWAVTWMWFPPLKKGRDSLTPQFSKPCRANTLVSSCFPDDCLCQKGQKECSVYTGAEAPDLYSLMEPRVPERSLV